MGTMTLRMRIATLTVAVLSMVGFTAAFMPGRASADWGDCAGHRLCVWIDQNATGARSELVNPIINACYSMTGQFVDSITSAWNRFLNPNYKVKFYSKQGCTGNYWYTLNPNQSINWLSWPHADNLDSVTVFP